MRPSRILAAAAVAVLASLPSVLVGQSPGGRPLDGQILSSFTYRNLGPFRMGARIADIAVPDSPERAHLYTMYVAPWTGGLFKTTNNGTTWEPIFDNVSTRLTVGDVTLSHSNPDIVWVGTGDAFTSRSSYAGDGVYKSTDAGKTWTHMGLDDTQHIARIVIDPNDPDVVYVAAMGHLYSTNEQRGVFKTTDGGRTWSRVLYINEKIGVIDLVMDPKDPNTLYAASYDKQRLPWQMINGGPESGVYKTTDAGAHWTRLGGGFPTGRIGRIGLDIYPKDPNVLYAIVENDNPPEGGAEPGARGGIPTIGGEVYRTDDGGATWRKTNPDTLNVSSKGPYYFNQIRVDPNDDMTIFLTGSPGGLSRDGGKTWKEIFPRFFGDNRTFWFDPENSNRMIMGSDGGIAVSYDGGETSDHFDNLPIGEIYQIGVDMEDPYNVYGGLQDHEHWRGPSINAERRGVAPRDWIALGDGDGMFTQVDPTDSRWLYTTRHYGGHTRVDQKLGYETLITPNAKPGEEPYRFIWTPPLLISPHDPKTLYTGAQMLLRSTDRGDHWEEISPDLSTHPADKILPESEQGLPGGIPWFAISAIAESPLQAGVLWVGTSDGKVQMSRDDGAHWTDMTPQLVALGARAEGYVSRVRASSHVPGRAYVAKRAYKFDDFRPMLYVTDDFGRTWRSISNGLPDEPINAFWEDQRNPDLLFVGDDVGVWVSIDRGAHWTNMNNNMPNVPVHDLLVHPREHDLVVGSYGRGFWVTNVDALEELTPDVLAQEVHLFGIHPAVQRITWEFGANDYLFAQRHIQTPNPRNGMYIHYYLKSPAPEGAVVTIRNSSGVQVARLQGGGNEGINTVVWSTRMIEGRGMGAGGFQGPAQGTVITRLAPLGHYTVTLEVDGKTLTGIGEVIKTQGWSIGPDQQTIR